MTEPQSPEPLCNLCGLTCRMYLGPDKSHPQDSGLVSASVWGGYESTPGNGSGALDDMTNYKFSICEFCLDWLFTQFTIPVDVYCSIDNSSEPFKPAIERVFEDDYRKDKETFYKEYLKRANARSKEYRMVDKYRKLGLFK